MKISVIEGEDEVIMQWFCLNNYEIQKLTKLQSFRIFYLLWGLWGEFSVKFSENYKDEIIPRRLVSGVIWLPFYAKIPKSFLPETLIIDDHLNDPSTRFIL